MYNVEEVNEKTVLGTVQSRSMYNFVNKENIIMRTHIYD